MRKRRGEREIETGEERGGREKDKEREKEREIERERDAPGQQHGGGGKQAWES